MATSQVRKYRSMLEVFRDPIEIEQRLRDIGKLYIKKLVQEEKLQVLGEPDEHADVTPSLQINDIQLNFLDDEQNWNSRVIDPLFTILRTFLEDKRITELKGEALSVVYEHKVVTYSIAVKVWY